MASTLNENQILTAFSELESLILDEEQKEKLKNLRNVVKSKFSDYQAMISSITNMSGIAVRSCEAHINRLEEKLKKYEQ